jgi:hypothetical protein
LMILFGNREDTKRTKMVFIGNFVLFVTSW